jgi:hypothetical protein
MAIKKVWVLTPQKKVMTEKDKAVLVSLFEPLIDDYKTKFIEAKPDKKHNYVIDFYTKFYRGFFYMCAKYKGEHKNRILDGFETKFARLEFVEKNTYNLAYFRRTWQWWTVNYNVTPEYCFENIKNNP